MTTTPLVPIMLFGWVPFTVVLFFLFQPHRAVLISVIGGWLFLPMTGFDILGLPEFSKYSAISLSLILGGILSRQLISIPFELKILDLPMIVFCLCPILTSLSNGLGIYNGFSDVYSLLMLWGVPYFTGRIYFKEVNAIKDLCIGIVIGGLIYVPLCWYEIRMSPQLSKIFYGFFQHEWRQHYRYGGWRPIVFMQHGLMVAFWMASSAVVAFWIWREKLVLHIKGIPLQLITAILILTALLCKCGNGWALLSIGIGSYYIHRSLGIYRLTFILFLIVLAYPMLRLFGIVSGKDIETIVSPFFDAERMGSLGIRLKQEDLFIDKALKNLMFGWGGYSRSWPVDPITGEKMIKMVDSLWIITLGTKGVTGLAALFFSILSGPWAALQSIRKKNLEIKENTLIAYVLSLVVIMFIIDSLVNAMTNSTYLLVTGALVTWHHSSDIENAIQQTKK